MNKIEDVVEIQYKLWWKERDSTFKGKLDVWPQRESECQGTLSVCVWIKH